MRCCHFSVNSEKWESPTSNSGSNFDRVDYVTILNMGPTIGRGTIDNLTCVITMLDIINIIINIIVIISRLKKKVDLFRTIE